MKGRIAHYSKINITYLMQKQFISNHKFNQMDENTYEHWFKAHKNDFQRLHEKIAWVFSYILIFSKEIHTILSKWAKSIFLSSILDFYFRLIHWAW